MKTTIELADHLLKAARKRAEREGTTLRALVEEGLRRVLNEDDVRARKRFQLRRASFKGKGLNPGVEEGSWERVRDAIYEGRGA
ncbi:MAG: type II toxin-antitoxin system VapB family antitoxin [Longimicrobiales bacterium]